MQHHVAPCSEVAFDDMLSCFLDEPKIETEVMNSQTNISQAGIARVMAGLDTSLPQGKVEDISSAALMITSDEGKFMNGSVVVIDGGVSCN